MPCKRSGWHGERRRHSEAARKKRGRPKERYYARKNEVIYDDGDGTSVVAIFFDWDKARKEARRLNTELNKRRRRSDAIYENIKKR